MQKSKYPYPELTQLKRSQTIYPENPQEAVLETFENRFPDRGYQVTFCCPEFTARCPVTGQPDFGDITIIYFPLKRCIDSKSLKLYLYSYRNHNTFHEDSVNQILDDVVKYACPREATVIGKFRPRGGISITVTAAYKEPGMD